MPTPPAPGDYDAVIIGGGPAGLSAALVLGRSRRRVLVCDTSRPRNISSRAMHAYLSRDGADPAEFLRIARDQLAPYGVELLLREALDVAPTPSGFRVALGDGRSVSCRKVVLATGVVDRLPAIEGIADFFGRSVFHCPYCDGWEVRDRRLAAYGPARKAFGLARGLLTWSRDVVLCTGGVGGLTREDRATLAREGISIREEPIVRLEGKDGNLRRIMFASGVALEREALFFETGQYQRSALAEKLGCEFNAKGTVRTNRAGGTRVPGIFVAGDASEDVQLVIVAAAEGAKAGMAINRELQIEDLAAAAQRQPAR